MSQLSSNVAGTRPWFLGATTLVTRTWLVRLRWTTVFLQCSVVVVSLAFQNIDFPLRRVAPLLFATIALNAVTAVRWQRGEHVPAFLTTIDAVANVLLLTELLELTGGPFNPFVVIYAGQAAVVWLTVGRAWGSVVGVASAVAFGFLTFWHLTELVPGHHRLNDFPTHLFTMWMAVAITAELAAYFATQASNAIARREEELETMRRRAARDERLMSLTTLAAGAAHELSTPLATIALASKELERAAATNGAPELLDDARLIRQQVDRCQVILDEMSGRAGGTAVDAPETIDIPALIAEVRASVAPQFAERIHVRMPDPMVPLCLPHAGLRQVLLSLLNNAFDADPRAASPVALDVRIDNGVLRVEVRDEGPGMTPHVLQRAGEPFFTTKDAGRGRGLGLFLARLFAERCGGTLTLRSEHGTTAVLEVPASSPRGAAA